MKTLSIKFFLKGSKKETNSTVFVQLIYNRTKTEFSTGIKHKTADWNQSKQEFRKSTLLNQRIAEIRENIYRAKNSLDDLGSEYIAKDIKLYMAGERKDKVRLKDFMEEFLNSKMEDSSVRYTSVQKYNQTVFYIGEMQISKGLQHINVSQINLDLINHFDAFLKSTPWNENGDFMKTSTINKHHSRLKAIINHAIKKGYLASNPYTNFKLSFPTAKREYLTSNELEALKNADISDNSTLEVVRDIFLFTCYTGLRYQDAMNLTISNVVQIGNDNFIDIMQVKTNEHREIPLLNPALELIGKYALHPEE